MAQRYVDIPSIMQVIGGIYANPNLLDMEDKYFFVKKILQKNFIKLFLVLFIIYIC